MLEKLLLVTLMTLFSVGMWSLKVKEYIHNIIYKEFSAIPMSMSYIVYIWVVVVHSDNTTWLFAPPLLEEIDSVIWASIKELMFGLNPILLGHNKAWLSLMLPHPW